MMVQFHMEDGKYRVILHRIGRNTEEEKARFCGEVSENYGIPLPLMRKIADRCPIVIKKDLPFKKAEMLAIAFKSSGASVSVERKRNLSPVFLEFMTAGTYRLGLESSNLRKSPGGAWQVFGRIQNISNEELHDVWALIQLFDEYGELITFEEIPLPINPLPPNESSPLKAIFEGELPVQKISIAFKNASGNPLPAMDKRQKREWVEVKIAETGKKSGPLLLAEISEEVLPTFEPQISLIPEGIEEKLEREVTERASVEISPPGVEELPLTSDEEIKSSGEELALTFFEKGRQQHEEEKGKEEERFEIVTKEDRAQEVIRVLLDEGSPEEEELHLDYPTDDRMEDIRRIEPDFLLFEKGEPVTEEKPATVETKTEGEALRYPWLEDFKKTIEVYDQMNRDPFLFWFENLQKEGKFEDVYHSLLTLLIYTRFNQTHPSDTALENTQKVFHLTLQTDLPPEEFPPLEGALFFPSEAWRDLYIRAIPKLQEVSHRILEGKEWGPSDLDRLIRIIPHMTARNSRWAIRAIHDWIPEVILDVSDMPIDISEGLYRVASRLGVVNPLFDYYQGKNSMGDLRIQSFARTAFPDDPGKIEGPMSRLGAKDEGGHCWPTEPRCQDCPFEGFCQKLFLDFNPAEKGMILL
ncbi:MAG: hypothetical protein MUO28_10265 [Desulfobacterales bacterium]|nr:hypothetical protein [Desulfobacterales bacterium]